MSLVTPVIQAYRFAPEPGSGQERALRSHCGGQRRAFNWGLAQIKANLDQRAAEETYGLVGDELTPPVSWSAYRLRKDWNQAKGTVAPWWAENSKEAYSSGLANLATALGNWADSQRGKRNGRGCGFPRFKGKRSGLSCRFTTGAFGLACDRRHVRLPRIGLVRTHESTRKLARHVERGTARIRSATVSLRAGRWFVSFSVEITRADSVPVRQGSVVGVDLGVHTADRWYPSSKTCSGCGVVKARLRLSERAYRCEACGLVLDRDLNAACNLAALVHRETSSPSCGATVNEPAGNPGKTRTSRATDTATGRPAPGAGRRRRRKAPAA